MCVMWRMSQICVGCKSLHKYLQKILEIQKESNRNPTRDKSEDNDFQGYQSFVGSQEGRMSLTLKNSSASARSSAGYAETSRRSSIMPAMPSMKSLMFKEEEFTVGFWPGCQAPDLKEVPNFSAIFSSLLDILERLVMITKVPCLSAGTASTFDLANFRGKFVLLLFQVSFTMENFLVIFSSSSPWTLATSDPLSSSCLTAFTLSARSPS